MKVPPLRDHELGTKAIQRRIILDTNFLMIPGQFGVDIFGEIERICDFPYKVYTVQMVKDELAVLALGRDAAGRRASLALSLLEKKGVPVVEAEDGGMASEPSGGSTKVKNADTFILGIVRRDRDIVATMDGELRRALKGRGIPQIVLRKRCVLEIHW